MKRKLAGLAFSIAVLAANAAAQTVTGSGTMNTVPVFTGASTVGNSPISVSGSNVGIGTTNPASNLDVNGPLFLKGKVFADSDAASTYIKAPSGAIYFYPANGTVSNVMAANGSVGIGTTSPHNMLDVSGGIGFSNQNSVDKKLFSPADGLLVWLTQSAAGAHALEIQTGSPSGSTTSTITNVHLDANGNSYLNALTGNVGIGTTSPGAVPPSGYTTGTPILEVKGDVVLTRNSGGSITFQDGTTQSSAYTGVVCGGDYAESVDVTGSRANYEPGDVLVIDPNAHGRFLKGNQAYSTLVAGIFSTKPGTVGRRQTTTKSADEVPMAVVGIVPTKVSAENGAIKDGDLLVASSTLGHAMKGTDRSKMLGAVIGKALGSLESGTGVIEVLVTLQ
jgi:hypothetical protein